MNIAVTGYCGTGSSAVCDLLMEYQSCSEGKLSHYEHIPFYTPDGLFDLEDKLLVGNNLQRSDEAIDHFVQEMRRLNDNNFGWFGGYKKHFGEEFMASVNQFVEEITEFSFPGGWSYTAKKMQWSPVQFAKDCIRTVLGKKMYRNFGEQQKNSSKKDICCSFVTEEEFYESARLFVQRYLAMTQAKTEHTIYDHLVLPHNLWRMAHYFDSDFKVIVVDRDVRDLFVLGKYVWPSMGAYAPFPRDVEKFVNFWHKMRACEQHVENDRILRINFEELIYEYDQAVAKIETFLGLNSKDHIQPKKILIPEKSIKNTQNFKIKPEWAEEVKILEEKLSQYIYKFPYDIETSMKETFDQ